MWRVETINLKVQMQRITKINPKPLFTVKAQMNLFKVSSAAIRIKINSDDQK